MHSDGRKGPFPSCSGNRDCEIDPHQFKLSTSLNMLEASGAAASMFARVRTLVTLEAMSGQLFRRSGSTRSTLRTPWSNCYRTASASELIWLRRNVTGGRFSNLYQRAYFACTNLANHRRCTKLLAHWQWRGRSRCGLRLLQNTQSFWSQSAHTQRRIAFVEPYRYSASTW